MAVTRATPRDRLERLVDLGRKTLRYWWLVLGFVVLGAGLSVLFAVSRTSQYKSWSVLYYQERIQTSLLQGRDQAAVQRNIGERYRELLLAHGQLSQIVNDPELNAYKDVLAAEGTDAAVEELRRAVEFQIRGANTFRVSYTDPNRDRAKAVTEKLVALLTKKEEDIRRDQAEATAKFAEESYAKAQVELREAQSKLSGFLAKHPEFAQDAIEGSSEGAAIRARQRAGGRTTSEPGNPRLQALERQRARLRARLDAADNPGAPPPPRTPAPPTPERLAALAQVDAAKRELDGAERTLEEAAAKYTDKHPAVVNARDQVAAAKERLRRAQAAVPAQPADPEVVIAPATAADRAAIERELSAIEGQIAEERRRNPATTAPTPAIDESTSRVVQLETEQADLRGAVNQARERVEALAQSLFRAQIDTQQQIAEQGSRLTIVDPAFRPTRPIGKGKKLVVMAGVALFGALGLVLALGLALIDDRLYRRIEIEELELAPVLAVIGAAEVGRRAGGGGGRGRARRASAGPSAAPVEGGPP